MIICPVCENQQAAGDECTVCGKVFKRADVAAVATERVEGLEPTVPDQKLEVPVERVPELDMGRFEKVEAPPDATPGLELNQQAQVGAVPVERIGDLTDDRAADDGIRVALPIGPVACRYCGNQQAEGLVCDRCGMRLPVRASTPDGGTARPKGRSNEGEAARCLQCGNRGIAGARCKECGSPIVITRTL
jgi:hypothetical protein